MLFSHIAFRSSRSSIWQRIVAHMWRQGTLQPNLGHSPSFLSHMILNLYYLLWMSVICWINTFTCVTWVAVKNNFQPADAHDVRSAQLKKWTKCCRNNIITPNEFSVIRIIYMDDSQMPISFRIENNFRNFSSPNETRKSHLFIITFQQPKRKRNWKQRVNAKKIFRTQTVVERLSKSFVLFLLLLLLEGYPERVAATETNTSKNGSNIRQHSHVE